MSPPKAADPRRQSNQRRVRLALGITGAMVGVVLVVLFLDRLTLPMPRIDPPELVLGRINQQVVVFKVKRKRLPESILEVYEDPEDRPVDHWGTPFRLVLISPHPGYDIQSAGPDRTFGTPDDIAWSSL